MSGAGNLAGQAAGADKPVFNLSGGGGGNDIKNWGVGGQVGAGTKIWESQNGAHSVGAAATYGQSIGRSQGHSWQSKPNVGVGLGYRFRF